MKQILSMGRDNDIKSLKSPTFAPVVLCLIRMPPEMTWVEGAFVQPMALAVYGVQRAGVKPGHRVLVCGAGSYVL